jgi:hypothetical protein
MILDNQKTLKEQVEKLRVAALGWASRAPANHKSSQLLKSVNLRRSGKLLCKVRCLDEYKNTT